CIVEQLFSKHLRCGIASLRRIPTISIGGISRGRRQIGELVEGVPLVGADVATGGPAEQLVGLAIAATDGTKGSTDRQIDKHEGNSRPHFCASEPPPGRAGSVLSR